MQHKKIVVFVLYVIIVTLLGILPLFIPISIMDYSKHNWNGMDLAENVTGDYQYYNATYLNLTQPSFLNVYDVRGRPYKDQVPLAFLSAKRADIRSHQNTRIIRQN